MKWLHISDRLMEYDGSQLSPLWAYLNTGLQGDSIVSFLGPCQVHNRHMVDMEDLRDGASIASSQMVHFLVELFGSDVSEAVLVQRLLIVVAQELLSGIAPEGAVIERRFDNLYASPAGEGGLKKLSISVASASAVSAGVHFAMNISSEGTPVPTCSLTDLGIRDVTSLAESIATGFIDEVRAVRADASKVRPLA